MVVGKETTDKRLSSDSPDVEVLSFNMLSDGVASQDGGAACGGGNALHMAVE